MGTGLNSISLFAALTDKMRWNQQRQTLLAENVANADTPGYVGHDLKAFSFGEELSGASRAQVSMSLTSPNHISASSGSDGGFAGSGAGDFETTPVGNAVSLEDEMMKVTANQMDYQTITTLYTRSMRLIRTALGRQA